MGVCGCACVYERDSTAHFWCIPHYLKFINAAEHLAALEKQNVKVKLPVAKRKYQELYVGFLFFFFFGGYNNFVMLLPIIAEIVFFFPLKKPTHTEKEGD